MPVFKFTTEEQILSLRKLTFNKILLIPLKTSINPMAVMLGGETHFVCVLREAHSQRAPTVIQMQVLFKPVNSPNKWVAGRQGFEDSEAKVTGPCFLKAGLSVTLATSLTLPYLSLQSYFMMISYCSGGASVDARIF
jgi:hypothetical protein